MSWANPKHYSDEAVARKRAAARVRDRRYEKKRPSALRANRKAPFLGCDGEGAGIDDMGRQVFRLFRIGDRELYFGGERLTTADCLEFILASPKAAVLVGFYFTYDATMILRDLPARRMERLLMPRDRGEYRSPYTYWRDYAIEWRPKQYLRIARRDGDALKAIPGTSRTINEVSGYFRTSFVEVVEKHGAGTGEERDFVARMKEARGGFTEIGEPERRYCALECRLLAGVMEDLRENCKENDLIPQAWRGPGYLAALLHKRHSTPHRDLLPHRAERFAVAAEAAYYAGRFEVVRFGAVDQPVVESDLNSTYAAVLPHLPCPLHTTWRRFRDINQMTPGDLFLADITFGHASDSRLCHLPIRHHGRLMWPMRGQGVYWSPELLPALRAGTVIHECRGGYRAVKHCDCKPFQWVHPLYDLRRQLGADSRGYPLKIVLAALYGKFVQREGSAPWRDIVAGGLVTATVRGWLIDAYRDHEEDVIMLASDAIYSTRPLALDYGVGLGQWEPIERSRLFIVQPGLYWAGGEAPKTRGIPRSAVIAHAAEFEKIWRNWLNAGAPGRPPYIPVMTPLFIGPRLAQSMGDMALCGTWRRQSNRISFSWAAKRTRRAERCDGGVVTRPLRGSYGLRSEPYDPLDLTEFRQRQLEDEAMPDFVPWGNTGE